MRCDSLRQRWRDSAERYRQPTSRKRSLAASRAQGASQQFLLDVTAANPYGSHPNIGFAGAILELPYSGLSNEGGSSHLLGESPAAAVEGTSFQLERSFVSRTTPTPGPPSVTTALTCHADNAVPLAEPVAGMPQVPAPPNGTVPRKTRPVRFPAQGRQPGHIQSEPASACPSSTTLTTTPCSAASRVHRQRPRHRERWHANSAAASLTGLGGRDEPAP